jgi:hypothetical protein
VPPEIGEDQREETHAGRVLARADGVQARAPEDLFPRGGPGKLRGFHLQAF